MNLSTAKFVFLMAVIAYTLSTAWTDIRHRKIYNSTTVTMWSLGWIYQAVFYEWHGLKNGLLGFLIGFGLFFVLWLVGTAGGGDAKLMGGLGVWVGKTLIVQIILTSLIFVVISAVVALVVRSLRRDSKDLHATLILRPQGPKDSDEAQAPIRRRVTTFAGCVALATWTVLTLFPHLW